MAVRHAAVMAAQMTAGAVAMCPYAAYNTCCGKLKLSTCSVNIALVPILLIKTCQLEAWHETTKNRSRRYIAKTAVLTEGVTDLLHSMHE